ncbi:HI1506-related protein [Pseudomonas spirodelae]|uniref:HI1506-related protein n=1 Tax=Pseudomonas spirodelae TaxID=3101751 RepID=A0ABU5P7U0_9PSED|nr:HI1506-related protein [Pseudomonas sp. T5W1]MEA1605741.1 HI1506-related protein [Pseudomonas sp. T5W1]
MARRQTTGSTKAPAKSADKAAPAAASATAEQLGNQPADITDNAAPIPKAPPGDPVQPVSEASAGLEAGNQGQDAPTVLVVGGLAVGEYIAALKAGGVNVILLQDLDEPLLRHVGQFLQVDQYDVLPPEQLVSIIEAEVGIEPAADTGLQALAATAPASSDAANSSDDSALDDDGDIEGLWITAVPEQGFRRCGFRFTREGFAIALDALTAEQIEQLQSEPNLKVERGIFSGLVEVQ